MLLKTFNLIRLPIMDVNSTNEFIQNIYSSFNISHSLVIYDKDETLLSDIEELHEKLIENDFPVHYAKSIPKDFTSYETKYRMFLIDYNDHFKDIIITKNNDLSNISIIFCLSPSLLHKVCQLLKECKVKTMHSMHLFSC